MFTTTKETPVYLTITDRDWFAGKSMLIAYIEIIAKNIKNIMSGNGEELSESNLASMAYKIADAMLKEQTKQKEDQSCT